MTDEEKRKDFTRRVEEAVAYCRANFKIGWMAQLLANNQKIEATIGYVDYTVYEKLDQESDKSSGGIAPGSQSSDGKENPSEKVK